MANKDFPPHVTIQEALLKLLYAAGGPMASSETYEPLAKVFSLSAEQRARPRPDTGESAWNNRVQWARRKLREDGHLISVERGRWGLTATGKIYAAAKFPGVRM